MRKITDASIHRREIDDSSFDGGFARRVRRLGVPNLSRCYQCLRCAAGCPLASAMDYTPSQIMRMATLGMKEEILDSSTIWLCASCMTCTTRCPMEIDVAGVMDALKELALEEGRGAAQKNVRDFHRIFMNIVRARGRMLEPLLLGHYKLRTRTFAQDARLGGKMVAKRKLRFYSPKIAGAKKVRAMMDAAKKKGTT
ncbi:MAG: 4Fe-4S dicluster domain-containing protein [bacterium]